MKDFIKYTLASLLGVVLAGLVLTILSIVTLAGMLSSSGKEPEVKSNTVFTLLLDGEVVERSTEISFAKLLGDEYKSLGLNDILSAIKKAKENENITGIFLRGGHLTASPASLEEIRNALIDFKESEKFIVSYADNYTQGAYYLVSVSDKVVLNPQGTLSWKGISAQSIFFKDIMEKVGVKMEVFKVGTYKAAVEPFIATQMSPENREQLTAYTSSIWEQMVTGVSLARSIPVETLNEYADKILELRRTEDYIRYNLVDTLLYQEGMTNYVKELAGRKEDEKLRSLDLSEMVQLTSNKPKDKSGNAIAIYYAVGEIDGNSSSIEGINSEKTIKALRKLRDEESIKAVVLRINSPGGSAYGSEQIWQEVKSLRDKKPVIVSMGDYAASGGYYIASAANYIIANPTTLTGSVGIFGMIPNAEELLTKKLGLHFDVVNTHEFSDMGSIGRSLKPQEREAIQQMVNDGYETFVSRCAEGRNTSVEAIKKVGEGRIWTGEMAKQLGLVDQLGGIEEAILLAAQNADITAYSLQYYPEQEGFLSMLIDSKDSFLHSELKKSIGKYASAFQFIQHINSAEPIQARIPFELIIE